jgi:hypothetical protein
MHKCIKTPFFNHFRPKKNNFLQAMILVIWKYAQMHKNTSLTSSDLKNYFFQAKILVVWKNAQVHQNTFLTTSDLKKYIFSGHYSDNQEVCTNAPKHLLNLFRPKKIFLFRP